ncbi:MAG TPA: hypothetical protein VLD62_11695 [Acidimicrobiia bacterium]|nr:hypothetical protein [Acidimicrobiia bacterium]
MAEGVVFDLGYKPHEGERLGRAGALRALLRDGLRRVLGLRRRARSKVIPWSLLGIALLPAMFFTAFGVVLGELDVTDTIFGHARYFNLTGTISLIFVSLAASELTVPDRTNGTMAIYASRPLMITDYLWGRAAALATVVFGFLYLPHVLLYLGRAWTSSEGFGSYAIDNVATLWETAAASAVYILAYAPVAFLIGTFSSRTAVAAGATFGAIVFLSGGAAALVEEAGMDAAGFLAIQDHPNHVKDWLMSENTDRWIPESAGLEPWASLLAIVVVAVACIAVVRARYRSVQ